MTVACEQVAGERDSCAVPERGAGGHDQVALGLDAAELRRLNEAVEQRGDLGAAPGPGPVMIPTPEDDAAEATLGEVVVQRDTRIVEKARQQIGRASCRERVCQYV